MRILVDLGDYRALAIDPTINGEKSTDPGLLTADDVCIPLKVKRNWLYDTVESEAIEAIRLGKQLRFRPSAIASYLIERAQAEKRT